MYALVTNGAELVHHYTILYTQKLQFGEPMLWITAQRHLIPIKYDKKFYTT